MFLIASLAGSGDINLKLGDEIFEAGKSDRLSKAIAKAGPILIADASPNQTRDIYIQHLGDDPEKGWIAFAARANGAPRECYLEWKLSSREFVDPCSTNHYPADGKGLTGYSVEVRDGKVLVDLRLRGQNTQESERSSTSVTR